MKVIIELDSTDYMYIKNGCIVPIKIDNHIYDAIRSGTVLPEGHGDLIDREKLKSFKCAEHSSDKEDIDDYETEEERDLACDRKYFYRSGWNDAVEFIIEKAPTIILADKEDNNGQS